MAKHVGIRRANLDDRLKNLLLPLSAATLNIGDVPVGSQLAIRSGVKASNVMIVPANVVDGDVITISTNTFEVDIINTDSAVNTANDASGALNGTDVHSTVTLGAAPATAISVGDVIRIENEMMLVLRKISTTVYIVARAYAATTIASHAQNLDVFVSNSVPTNISVPLVTTLTPAAFGPAFAAVFNYVVAAGESQPARSSSLAASYTAYSLLAGQQVLVVKNVPGVDTTATTEDFANSTDNVWANATLVGGVAPTVARCELASRAATSGEELGGAMHFPFSFTVRSAVVQVQKATGELVQFAGQVFVGWTETTTEVLPGSIVTVRNAGQVSTAYITPFAATDVVSVLAFE